MVISALVFGFNITTSTFQQANFNSYTYVYGIRKNMTQPSIAIIVYILPLILGEAVYSNVKKPHRS